MGEGARVPAPPSGDQVEAARDWLRRHGVNPCLDPGPDSGLDPASDAGADQRADPRADPRADLGAGRRPTRGSGTARNPDVEVEDRGRARPGPRAASGAASRRGRAASRRRAARGGGGTDAGVEPTGAEAKGSDVEALDAEGLDVEGPDAEGPDADPEEVARRIVLRKLSAQARTRAELERALQGRAVPEETAAAVLDRMGEVGLVDDTAFARDWVASRQQRRHLSRTALRRELQTKGVDREVIDQALADVVVADEHRAALDLARRRSSSLHGLPHEVAYRRLGGVLARRGFSASITSRVLAEVLGGPRED